MTFAFDLISDIHVDTWNQFDWAGQSTSPFCVVAGDVCSDHQTLVSTLTHLGQCYPGGVFYIDGNAEHYYNLSDLTHSYQELQTQLTRIPNVVYLQDNVVIVNGVAILGTNAWWSYDFDPSLDFDQSVQFVQEHCSISQSAALSIGGVAYHDTAYLINSVRKLQTHPEVKAIVVVTHTVPDPELIDHDTDLIDHWRFNGMGNSSVIRALEEDTEHKVKAWCFGHYHKPVDWYRKGIKWVCNPRGRGNTDWCQQVYYPKRIEIEL
jgi:predicted phosphohydrolase